MEKAMASVWKTLSIGFDKTCEMLPNLFVGIFVFWLFSRLADLIRKLIIHICQTAKMDITLSHALATLSFVFINIIGALVTAVIVIPGFKMVHVVSGLGITSVAIGFAFKDILQNFLAGMLLLWQKPFVIGDLIKTTDFEGIVEEIRIRSTHLRTDNGDLIVVPNGDIFTHPITIKTAYKQRRSEITVAANPNRSIDTNRSIIQKVLSSTASVIKNPAPEIYLVDAGLNNPTFKVSFWTDSSPGIVNKVIDTLNSNLHNAMLDKEKSN